MPQRPSGWLDWLAWALLLAGLAVAACVLSQEPDGTNLLGAPGNLLAHQLLQYRGQSSFVYTGPR